MSVGLKLIQGQSERSTKPRVIVVAEPSVHFALMSDPELDVYPDCFDYDSFVKASLSKSISTNNSIVLLSDSLSQRVAPLEAVIALVRKNVILIPWKSREEDLAALNVVACSARPTANTLRRSIFEHAGMKDLPPRFDGDDYIEEPPDARVMNFAPQVEETQMTDPTQFLPPAEQQRIADEQRKLEQAIEAKRLDEQAEQAARTASVQVDEPSFLPEYFGGKDVNSLREPSPFGATDSQAPVAKETAPQTHEHNTPGEFESADAAKANAALESLWSELTPKTPSSTVNFGAPAATTAHAQHPYVHSDSLELEAYVSNQSDMNAYDVEDSSPASFLPDVAFTPVDNNGNQQMWTMFDSKIEHPSGRNNSGSMTDFPDGSDSRKAISLSEPLVLCVYSPKGGVGKTSISVNMAARLAYTTRLQVCIVDLDIAFGNVGTRLGLYNPTVRELLNESHIDGESIARNLVYDRRSGLFALLAPLRPETGTNRRKFSPAAYKKILTLLKERFDVIILDCPVELRDPLVSGFALTEAGQVVMVVNNEQATLLDARRALEAMCRPKDSQRLPGLGLDPTTVGMVVNQKVDNVGREVDDIKAVLGGGDPNHPSKQIEILSVIADDRHLWVGNANMARTVATSGENDVDHLLDDIWKKILPDEAANEFEIQHNYSQSVSALDEILSREEQEVYEEPKVKKKRKLFGKSDKGRDTYD